MLFYLYVDIICVYKLKIRLVQNASVNDKL